MIYRWREVPRQQLNPLTVRQVIHGERMTLARFDLKKGATVAEHSHHNEQFTTIQSGAARFILDGEEQIVGAGESVTIAPHVRHSVEAMEDTIAIDVFSPPREDWK